MQNGLWRLVSKKETKLPASKADKLEKWEMKAEKAAGEIYLLVENDQRVHFRGHKEDPIKMWELLEAAHLSKKLLELDYVICHMVSRLTNLVMS